MQHSTNPFKPEEHINHRHVKAIAREALQDWSQRAKFPHRMDGKRGDVMLTHHTMVKILSAVDVALTEHADHIDRWIKPNENEHP